MNDTPRVIVVGSGPAGISVAWPMVRAGISVLMIDASSNTQSTAPRSRPLNEFRVDADRWRDRFGPNLAGLAELDGVSPKFSMPQMEAVLDGFCSRNGVATRNFFAAGSLANGGLSKVWGALAVPFEDSEFAGFPFDAAALRASYEAVTGRIGVSGGAGSDPITLTSEAARLLLARYELRKRDAGFELQPATNAVLEEARDGRQACSRCGLCLFGCSRGSIYDSACEIPALQRFDNFSYRSDHFVRAIHADGSEHVLDVEVGNTRRTIRAPVIVLAAGAIATSALALRRLNWIDRPVRLLTTPAAAAAFFMPRFIGRDLPDHSFGLGQLFYRIRTERGGAAGVVYGADALPVDLFAARMPVGRPFALRLADALAPALLMTTCYVPGALSQNTLSVHERDGKGSITIEGTLTRNALQALRAALKQLQRSVFWLGAIPVPGSATFLQPGADAHYGGTLPMNGEGPVFTSARGELNGCPGLFIADGAALPRLPSTHPTLTIMANADRIGHEITRRLQSERIGNLADSPSLLTA
ncbi:MAG: GMC oxidoreductase [Methylovirgula sp.]